MKFYLAVTDNNWYHFLTERHPDEINFWQPGGKTGFKAIDPGAPFLFRPEPGQLEVRPAGMALRRKVPLQLPALSLLLSPLITPNGFQPQNPVNPLILTNPGSDNVQTSELEAKRSESEAFSLELEPFTLKLEPQSSDIEPFTLKLEPQTSDFEPFTLKLEPQTSDFEALSSDCRIFLLRLPREAGVEVVINGLRFLNLGLHRVFNRIIKH